MKKIYLLLLTVSMSATFAQGQSDSEIIAYLDKNEVPVTDTSKVANIVYYRTAELVPGCCYIVKDYDLRRKLHMQAECSAVNPLLIRQGKVTYYHKNGSVDNEGEFNDDKRIGTVRYHHPSGMLKAEVDYQEDKTRYLQAFSETGQPTLINGNGSFTESGPKGTTYKEVKDSIVVADYYVTTTQDTIYTLVEKQPDYIGGVEHLMRHISKNIKYPANARRANAQGQIFLTFIITKDGEVRDVEVYRGFHKDCDAEAARVIGLSGHWHPGEYKNKPVNTQFIFPIKFKLGSDAEAYRR